MMLNNLFNLNYLFVNGYSYVLWRFHENINSLTLYDFFFNNEYLLSFLFIIYISILFDNTFIWRRKIFILFYFIFLVFILLFFKESFLINELFWYSLLLNGSFIFHVCICDWLYRLAKDLGLNYVAFIITRISYIFSLSFLMYLIHIFELELWNILRYSKYKKKKWFRLLYYNINILIFSIRSILLFFIILFTDYSLWLKGKKTYKLTLRKIFKFILYFTLTLVISWLILGIPRLYFIWFLWVVSFIYEHLKNCRYDYYYTYFRMLSIITWDFRAKLFNLEKDFNMVYAKGFDYDFIYFINFSYNVTNPYDAEYHIKCPFLYYSRERLLLSFFRSHFKKIISDHNYISKAHYDFVLRLAMRKLDLEEKEMEYFHPRLRKIYRRTLSIW